MNRTIQLPTISLGGLLSRAVLIGLIMAVAAPVRAQEPSPSTSTAAPLTESSTDGPAESLGALRFEMGQDESAGIVLRGADDQHQLIVTGVLAGGRQIDATRQLHFDVVPGGIVQVDATGLVTPQSNGTAVIHAYAEGTSAQVPVTVTQFGEILPVDFRNEIVPIFTKLGCNGGGCHGKSGGQNGFRLSLLGFEPEEDYEHLVLEARGRRLFPAAPESSLLINKATGRLPHGGGERLRPDSTNYRTLVRWIAQGMPPADPNAPVVTRIEVIPPARVIEPSADQQLRVVARSSDGSRRDVTRAAQYEPNDDELAEVTDTGLVRTKEQAGNVAIMARYQGQVGVFRVTVPLGAPVEESFAARNFVDELVWKQLKNLGLPPSSLADDATFLRRTCLDIAGRLPTLLEVEQFLADANPEKRDSWIDRLLESTDYADLFANKWSMVLRNKRATDEHRRGSYALHAWIRDRLQTNMPYDQFVREIVAAAGEVGENPPVIWYREVDQQDEQVEDLAQLFLGTRIKCARCHHHPFEIWSQDDYYGLAAFFSRVGRKSGEQPSEQRIFHRRGIASATNPKTSKPVGPRGLGSKAPEISADKDPRHALVDWMAQPDNPFFAQAVVNRYWKHFFGRGLVEPEDDLRVTNPPTNPELLGALASHFVQSGYDLKELVRTICQSRTYQLSAEPNEYNTKDKQSFSRFYPRRLPAEVLLDAVDDLTGQRTSFDGLPPGVRAVQLPDAGFQNYFLTVFGRPEASTACECERSGDGNLAQSLHLINSPDIQGKLSADSGRAAQLAGDKALAPEKKIRQLYLMAYARPPHPDESEAALAYLQKKNDERPAYEDLVWALINTKEFLFNH
jgi:hypothetical protein